MIRIAIYSSYYRIIIEENFMDGVGDGGGEHPRDADEGNGIGVEAVQPLVTLSWSRQYYNHDSFANNKC